MTRRDEQPNPFSPAPGAIPPLLVGREAELASISDACERVRRGSAPTPVAFLGLRGLGKTVLLSELRERTKGAVQVHLEVESGVSLSASFAASLPALRKSLDRTGRRIAAAIDEALRLLPMPSFELPHQTGAVTLRPPDPALRDESENLPLIAAIAALNEAAAAAKRYLVVTLDEVQDVDIEGLRSLVAAVHQSASSPAPILLALAGLPEAAETLRRLRTYARRWDRFELSFLTRAETIEAIRVPIERAGESIDDAALDLLANEAAGYPFFVQRYASAVWNQHTGARITIDDVRASLPPVRAMVEKLFYADEFAQLSPREWQFCRRLAELGEGAHPFGAVAETFGLPSSALSSVRSSLARKGILFTPSRGLLEFRMPLAARYVRTHERTGRGLDGLNS